jgi:acetolactate synthase-1/2/3 large subunit
MTYPLDPRDCVGATGAEVLHDILLAEGVDIVFTVPGAAIVDILDRLYDSPIRVILARHEQSAGHMADGYARSTGRTGVVLATSGPGATNLVTALATAHADSAGIVALTGQVKTHLLGTDAFQEAQTVNIFAPVTKSAVQVGRVEDLPRRLREAFFLARTSRCGPCLVDIPADVSADRFSAPPRLEMDLPGYLPAGAAQRSGQFASDC